MWLSVPSRSSSLEDSAISSELSGTAVTTLPHLSRIAAWIVPLVSPSSLFPFSFFLFSSLFWLSRFPLKDFLLLLRICFRPLPFSPPKILLLAAAAAVAAVFLLFILLLAVAAVLLLDLPPSLRSLVTARFSRFSSSSPCSTFDPVPHDVVTESGCYFSICRKSNQGNDEVFYGFGEKCQVMRKL